MLGAGGHCAWGRRSFEININMNCIMSAFLPNFFEMLFVTLSNSQIYAIITLQLSAGARRCCKIFVNSAERGLTGMPKRVTMQHHSIAQLRRTMPFLICI